MGCGLRRGKGGGRFTLVNLLITSTMRRKNSIAPGPARSIALPLPENIIRRPSGAIAGAMIIRIEVSHCMLMMNILETSASRACARWSRVGMAGVGYRRLRLKSHVKAAERLFYRKRCSPFGRFFIKELAAVARSGQRLPNEIAPRLDGEEG